MSEEKWYCIALNFRYQQQNYLFKGGFIIPTSCIHFLHTLFSKNPAFDLKKGAYYMFTKQNYFLYCCHMNGMHPSQKKSRFFAKAQIS